MKKLILITLLFGTYASSFAQAYEDYIGIGHSEGITVTSSDPLADGMKSINGEGYELEIQEASRFLAHATLGATIDEVEEVTQIGIEQWIDDQLMLPPSELTLPTIEIIYEFYDRCMETLGDNCDFNLNPQYFRFAWWDNAMKGQDQLRQRVAMALSEILVVSDQSGLEQSPHGLAYYYDILSRNAFGNYKDLLTEVSMSPAMGFYLSHMNNPKSIPILNIRPDENYAREIMQLFSIGLYELNQDGSRKVDMSTGLWIPTYDNDDIKGLAKVFTGLAGSEWADESNTSEVTFGAPPQRYSFLDQMAMYEFWHEPGEKTIVGDYTIPAGQTGMEDINDAIDHLFKHDNVGPFLALRLIQRLVKSNPSPDYITRIANVFNNNGQGVRGDLGSMVKAILTDSEAIECYWIDETKNGMLRAPMLRYTQMMKSLQAEVQTELFTNSGFYFQNFAGQHVLSSPTVFNFYTPDYVPDAEFSYLNMVGPEFQILNSSTSSNYVNYMLLALMQDYIRDNFNFDLNVLNDPNFVPYTANLEPYGARLTDEQWLSLANSPEELVDYLDILLTNGQLSDDRKDQIVNSMNRTDIFSARESAHYAAFMILIDPDYVIMK